MTNQTVTHPTRTAEQTPAAFVPLSDAWDEADRFNAEETAWAAARAAARLAHRPNDEGLALALADAAFTARRFAERALSNEATPNTAAHRTDDAVTLTEWATHPNEFKAAAKAWQAAAHAWRTPHETGGADALVAVLLAVAALLVVGAVFAEPLVRPFWEVAARLAQTGSF